jgi:hypothetical protein
LPPEQQAGSPKRHKGVTQKQPTVQKLVLSHKINKLQKDYQLENDPELKKQIGDQIRELQNKMRGGYERKL